MAVVYFSIYLRQFCDVKLRKHAYSHLLLAVVTR